MNPYKLGIISHKGGTGRTTSALALTWHLSEMGARVALVDADPMRAATRVACEADGTCSWHHVSVHDTIATANRELPDFVIVDGSVLHEEHGQNVLHEVDAVLLTCSPELMATRTLPSVTSNLNLARRSNPELEFLGVLFTAVNPENQLHTWAVDEIRHLDGELLWEPPIPFQEDLIAWPCDPGSAMPGGPASDAYKLIAGILHDRTNRSLEQLNLFGEE